MAVFNVSCLNVQRDPETGCAYNCGDRQDYQTCRQAFYLKQQNEILKQPRTTAAPTPTPSTIVVPQVQMVDPVASGQPILGEWGILGGVLIAGVLLGFLLKRFLTKP